MLPLFCPNLIYLIHGSTGRPFCIFHSDRKSCMLEEASESPHGVLCLGNQLKRAWANGSFCLIQVSWPLESRQPGDSTSVFPWSSPCQFTWVTQMTNRVQFLQYPAIIHLFTGHQISISCIQMSRHTRYSSAYWKAFSSPLSFKSLAVAMNSCPCSGLLSKTECFPFSWVGCVGLSPLLQLWIWEARNWGYYNACAWQGVQATAHAPHAGVPFPSNSSYCSWPVCFRELADLLVPSSSRCMLNRFSWRSSSTLSGHYLQGWFIETCISLCCGCYNLVPDSQGPEMQVPHWALSHWTFSDASLHAPQLIPNDLGK